ncbi:MAG: hypothetical protein WAL22_12070 [Solirubrobacteraceae bacterium]
MPGPVAKLDHCVIHVSDWAASNPFYRGNSDLCFEWDGPIEEAVEHLAPARGGDRGRPG